MSETMLPHLISLWDSLAESAQCNLCATLEDRKDFRDRALAEGLPYLSDGITRLGRLFLDGLRKGYIDQGEVNSAGFACKIDSTLPLFLYSAWSKVFADDGSGIGARFDEHRGLLEWKPRVSATVAVRWLRQLTIVFSKLQVAYTDEQANAVSERFIRNEAFLASIQHRYTRTQYANDVSLPHSRNGRQRLTDVLLNASRIIAKVLCNCDPRNLVPKHGSGASACGTRPWERYGRALFDPAQNRLWPFLEFTTAGRDHTDQILSSEFVTLGYTKRAKGVFVPKDNRGPRLISCEPATSMYYQQGLMTLLVDTLQHHQMTKGYVNFTNQHTNQVLAKRGSLTRDLATIDLRDASDLVAWDLVVLLFPKHIVAALSAVRSNCTVIIGPDGPITVPLRKHAPMGSATCFPVMAFLIWSIIKAARITACPRNSVWIYGDDIIIPSDGAQDVCDLLEAVGLSVNRSKSFYGATPFRESCGKEYWCGDDVTPIYCRYNPSNDDTAFASLCSFATNLVLRHGTTCTYATTQLVSDITGAPIIGVPCDINEPDCRALHSVLTFLHGTSVPVNDNRTKSRFNATPFVILGDHSQCMRLNIRSSNATPSDRRAFYSKKEYRIRRPYPVNVKVLPNSWGYVLRSALIGGDLGFSNAAALAKRVVYKYGWVSLDW